MGVIYELLKLPESDKKLYLEGIIHQEAMEKLSYRMNSLKSETEKWHKKP